jgi:hypothetical protein
MKNRNIPNIEQIEELTRQSFHPSVSIYIPAVKAGKETQQNSIRFKNALKKSETLLTEQNIDKKSIQELLDPRYGLLENSLFWQEIDIGMAAFFSLDSVQFFSVPVEFREEVIVAPHFYILPLLPLHSENGEFYVLDLNLDGTSLFTADRYSIEEISLGDCPVTLENFLQYDDQQRQQQTHTRRPERTGSRQAIFHGHGVGTDGMDNKKEQIFRFFTEVDKHVRKAVDSEQKPLVLFGAEYLHSIYRDTSEYPALAQNGVPAASHGMQRKEFHIKAWETVQSTFMEAPGEAVRRIAASSKTDQVAKTVPEIVKASNNGRVDTLLLAKDIHVWGKYNLERDRVIVHASREADDIELLNEAARNTLKNGSRNIYLVDKTELPSGSENAAAILRF